MKKVLFWGIALFASLGLISCDEDEYHRNVQTVFIGAVSEDLLAFVEPSVTYTDENRNIITDKLTETTWTKKLDISEESDDELNDYVLYAEISYNIRESIPDTIGKSFKFYHDITAVVASTYNYHDGGGFWSGGSDNISIDQKDGELSSIAYEVSGEAIEKYLNYIKDKKDKVTIQIGPEAHIKREDSHIIFNL